MLERGIEYFVPYSLRHTCLTRLGEAGCDAFTLARIAGHGSIMMTQRYVHPQAEAIALAFARVATSQQPADLPVASLPGPAEGLRLVRQV